MIRFPDKAFNYVNDRFSVMGIIRYALNWKKSRTIQTKVVPWLDIQIGEAVLDLELRKLVRKAVRGIPESDYDGRALAILKEVKSIIRYVGDTESWGTPEYWQNYKETLDKRTGDCEDGAILMYIMCRIANIPSNRLFLHAGNVRGGGHCWLGYRPSFNPTVFVHLDWCYWYSWAAIRSREQFVYYKNNIFNAITNKPHKLYHRSWWMFNEEKGYFGINSRSYIKK